MLNLILKDILLQKKILIILLVALVVYLLLGNSTIWVGIVFSIALIMNAFLSDEKSTVNFLLNTLPYTRKEIVSSKYAGAIVFMLMVLLTIFIGNWIIHGEIVPWTQFVLISSIVAVFISIAFPFSYLLKSQYLLIASILAFVVYMVILNSFIPNLNDRIRELTHTILSYNTSFVTILMVVSVGILYMFSWMLSIKIYCKKVF